MIIFGHRRTVKQIVVAMLVCGGCGNPTAHSVNRLLTMFTLFFILVIPLFIQRRTQCTFCGHVQKVSKQDVEAMLARSQDSGQQAGAPAVASQGPPQAPVSAQPQGYPQVPVPAQPPQQSYAEQPYGRQPYGGPQQMAQPQGYSQAGQVPAGQVQAAQPYPGQPSVGQQYPPQPPR